MTIPRSFKADKTVSEIKQNFKPFLNALNPELRSDFDTLCDYAIVGWGIGYEIKHLEAVLKAYLVALETVMHEQHPATGQLGTNGNSKGGRERPTRNKRKTARGQASKQSEAPKPATATKERKNGGLPIEEADELRLKLLRAKLTGADAFAAALEEVRQRLGPQNRKRGAKVLASLMAHANGKFRAGFAARVVQREAAGKDRVQALRHLAQLFDTTYESMHELVMKSGVLKDD